MTEKQGGSDVRANTTRAHARGARGRAALRARRPQVVLLGADERRASSCSRRPTGGLSCFLLPRFAPDGDAQRDAHPAAQGQARRLEQRERARSSSRARWRGWSATRDAASRRSCEMVALTRQDCMIGSAGLMRQALVQALHHARHRRAFGKRARRAAADAERARRPRARESRRRRRSRCASRARSMRAPRDAARSGARAHRHGDRQVLGVQARARRSSTRRRSASAAPATSRSRACRGCIGRRRSIRSGKAAGTSSASTCCARWHASRRRATRSSRSSTSARGANACARPRGGMAAAGARRSRDAGRTGAPDRRADGDGAAGGRPVALPGRPRSPRRSAPRAWVASTVRRSARSDRVLPSTGSSKERTCRADGTTSNASEFIPASSTSDDARHRILRRRSSAMSPTWDSAGRENANARSDAGSQGRATQLKGALG